MAADVIPNDLHRALMRLHEVFNLGAALVQIERNRIGAVEIDVVAAAIPSPESLEIFRTPNDRAMTLRSRA
jgi:hypothetical protein